MADQREDKRPLRAATVRKFVEWTPDLVRSAIRSADGGDMGRIGALCAWLLTDSEVAGALSARVDALTGLEVKFQPAANTDEVQSAAVIAALTDVWSTSWPEAELDQILTWGLLLGVCAARHAPSAADDGMILPNVEFWHPASLRQDQMTGAWSALDSVGVQHAVTPGDGEWLMFTPYGKARPWDRGLVNSLAMLVLAKACAYQDWARTSEKASLWVAEAMLDRDGNPVVGTGDTQRKQIVDSLDARGGDAVVGMPAGWQLKLLQTADTFAIFQEQINLINTAIAVRIRGGNLTTQVSGGSLAATEAQAANGDAPKLRKDSATLSTFLREQSVRWWAEWNYGDDDLAPWPKWEPKASVDVNFFSFMNAVSTAIDKGFGVDLEVLKNVYGMGFLTDYDPKRAVAPSFGGGFGGGFGARAQAHKCGPACGVRAEGEAAVPATVTDGQHFTDALSVHVAQESQPIIAAINAQLLVAVEEANTPDELKKKLREVFIGLDVAAMQAIFERAIILAEMAGRTQVIEEL